ncbi:MAG TPA: tetratricopeptide repeat protein [bacterium]|nr:tetratricopeptide repeat protein [Myxococcales bacterium]OQA61917.1 MAG: photosystem I assembly protein Ycf3 [bacterium ADurb.Bin270]HPW45614.1 tetratricopeptide repeat protein [bacterium]HQC50615.1 tetratricopeptide repeat protein [bacterium]HQG13883.1 tetratricopeptide repeat protein [bacterium]
MSLIHEALKKAQEAQKDSIGSGVSSIEGAAELSKNRFSKRTVVLAILLAISVGIFAYLRLKPKPGDVAAVAPRQPTTEAQQPQESDVALLKKRSIESYRNGDYNAAWSNLSAALNLQKGDPEIWNNLGMVEKKRGNDEKAREYYMQAIELKADYMEALNNVAVLDMQLGNNTSAIDYFTKALKVSPAYPEANFNLAFLYDVRGDKAKAAEYYKRFLSVGGNFPGNVIDSVRSRLMDLE